MEVQYLTDDNKPAKLFRENFFATGEMVAVAITRLLQDSVKKDELTTRMIKDKMHELLYNYGMGAFTDSPTAYARTICKEMYPDFYGEMKELPKAPVKKEEKPAKKTTPKADAGKKETRPAAPKSEKPATVIKSAVAPEFKAATT